ncbi:uncharacterized protein LOC119452589 [Dermacentor silvarum]|uniref:uncharacterized protein LOC119452589 n=1 Tax=Dermacentor silvarum TaxID=543639 RepID=UPI00210098F5|nr:uncharacterized protein LOC119452589 [Dermacentor silvarum]
MKRLYVFILAVFVSPMFSNGQAPNYKPNNKYEDLVKMVRKLLQQKGYLAISRGRYSQLDYPICVRSRFEDRALSGYFHKLTYYEQKEKRSGVLGKRHTLRAFFEVRPQAAQGLLVTVYLSGGYVDHRISGSYNILYADNTCFIVAAQREDNTLEWSNNTALMPTAFSQCLLWRRAAAIEPQRTPCRNAFRKLCTQYKGHKFVYTKERCTPNNDI